MWTADFDSTGKHRDFWREKSHYTHPDAKPLIFLSVLLLVVFSPHLKCQLNRVFCALLSCRSMPLPRLKDH